MDKFFEWAGGKKLGMGLIGLVIVTTLYVLGLCLEWGDKAIDADKFLTTLKWIIALVLGANVIGMGIHGFSKKEVSSAAKEKGEE